MVNAKKVAMVSLGCCKNKVDAEVMLAALVKADYEIVYNMAEADVIIINTCGFIHDAKVESVNAILEAAEYKKRRCKALVVTGCLSGRYADDLWEEIPEADAMLGVTQYPHIVDYVQRALNGERVKYTGLDCSVAGCSQRILTTPPWQGYLKIAEGCDNHCAFCVIPSIRGLYRSRPMEEVIDEARWMAEKGVQELVVVAQDTTRYGKDLYGQPSLPKLLQELCKIEGLKW
ncbi:MAG TPA: 30S ribosomal protein S12 methylthiotransferase RimO, partial [Ruminococcaceae bacterium]|nr:30S ribosomal protein S12 methylthiotransferase RimO [Oscillospiraceae bacterium]